MDKYSAIKFVAKLQNHEIENQNDIFLSFRTNNTKKNQKILSARENRSERVSKNGRRQRKRKGDYMTRKKTIIDACSMLIFKQISYIFRLKSKFGGIEKERERKNKPKHTDSADAGTMSMMHSVSYLCVSNNVFEIYIFYFPGSWPK